MMAFFGEKIFTKGNTIIRSQTALRSFSDHPMVQDSEIIIVTDITFINLDRGEKHLLPVWEDFCIYRHDHRFRFFETLLHAEFIVSG